MEDFDVAEMPFDPTKVDDLAQGGNFRVATRLGNLDIMQWLSGVPGDLAYPTLAADALTSSSRAWRFASARSSSCAR